MSTAHTPGPWVIIGDHQDERDVFADEELIASAYDLTRVSGDPRANARLIAAAPELLAALKAALPNLEWANIHGSRCEELLTQVKDAIRKSEI